MADCEVIIDRRSRILRFDSEPQTGDRVFLPDEGDKAYKVEVAHFPQETHANTVPEVKYYLRLDDARRT